MLKVQNQIKKFLKQKDCFPIFIRPYSLGMLLAVYQAYYKYLKTIGSPISNLFSAYGNKKLIIPKTASYYISAYEHEKARSQQMTIAFAETNSKNIAALLINSDVFFMFWRIYGDSFHVTANLFKMFYFPIKNICVPVELTKELYSSIKKCTVFKAYRGVDVPNVNLNLNLNLLIDIDKWILSITSDKLKVDHLQFLRAKSNSFFVIDIPKIANYSKVEPYIRVVSSETENEDHTNG